MSTTDLDEIEQTLEHMLRVCGVGHFSFVEFDRKKMFDALAYARRALRVERGMEKYKIQIHPLNDGTWFVITRAADGIHDAEAPTAFAAIEALLDKLEPQTEGSGR